MKKKVEKHISITPTSSNILDALMKKALGYEIREVVEEYSVSDNENEKDLKLIKKKVNTKSYPPDLDAIELVFNNFNKTESVYQNYSDEELIAEKQNLSELFKRLKGEKDESN